MSTSAPLGVQPQSSIPLSMFYDANNNPLNIPCEGPRGIQVNLDAFPYLTAPAASANEVDWLIDFTQVFQNKQFTALQSMYLDLYDFVQGESSGNAGEVICIFNLTGTAQRIVVGSQNMPNGTNWNYGASGLWVPIASGNPPQILLQVIFPGAPPSAAGQLIRCTFFNFRSNPGSLSAANNP
jgi:hypothetical protein